MKQLMAVALLLTLCACVSPGRRATNALTAYTNEAEATMATWRTFVAEKKSSPMDELKIKTGWIEFGNAVQDCKVKCLGFDSKTVDFNALELAVTKVEIKKNELKALVGWYMKNPSVPAH